MFGGTVSLQTSGRFLLTTSAGHCSKHLLRSTYQESQAFCTLQTVKRPDDAPGIDKQGGSTGGMRLPVCRCVVCPITMGPIVWDPDFGFQSLESHRMDGIPFEAAQGRSSFCPTTAF